LLRKLQHLWVSRPLACILLPGLFIRLVAAVFSKGFGMIDDHFLVIEQAQSWVDKVDINGWLPQLCKNAVPPGFSYFYTGLHYLLFLLLEQVGITDPDTKMYYVRVIHAVYSTLTIYFGYRITYKLTNIRYARQVGLLLAFYWFWPFLCVRNLVEVVCIPMLMWATWLAIKKEEGGLGYFFLVGILLGVAFNIRFQTVFFSAGFMLTLFIQRKFLQGLATFSGLVFCAFLFQGGIDYFIWHVPFAELRGYILYNLKYAHNFIILPWYSYLLLFSGILIPPVSLFLLAGFFSGFKKYLLLFLPSFLFLVFHSFFPNKQERFILPILPFIIMLGTIGANELKERKGWFVKFRKPVIFCRYFFSGLNLILLIVVSFTYSKRNRVEGMTYLKGKKDLKYLLVDCTYDGESICSPRFYLHQWPVEYMLTDKTKLDSLCRNLKAAPEAAQPGYIIFYESGDFCQRKAAMSRYFNLKYETTIYPGFVDRFMCYINPVNDNAVTYIYKITGQK